MKNEEKKVKATEEAKTEENGVQLTDEELSSVAAGGDTVALGDKTRLQR